MLTKRFAFLAAALVLGASTAHAQALATFGSAEVAGYGEGSVLLGTSLSTGHLGWGPVGTLVGQTYRYRNGTTHNQAWRFCCSVLGDGVRLGNQHLYVLSHVAWAIAA